MINEIYPHIFDNSFRRVSPEPADIVFAFHQKQALLRNEADGPMLPCFEQLMDRKTLATANAEYLFSIDKQRFFLTDMPDTVPENCQLYPTAQRFRELQPAHHAFAACTAEQIYRWRSSHRICGCCGTFMNNSTTERAAVCPNCGNTVYPKISPAIIVAITDHNRLLMAKNRNSLYKRYALIAGFVEIGESFEEAVQREAGEEVGIKIKNIRYYKSQPWGFSDSIMVGFFADLDGEDALTIQESELKEARWFSREDIPENPIRLSISQELIEAVRNGEHLRYK